MLKVLALLFVLGSAPLWVLAQGASQVGPEDGLVTPGVEDGTVTPGVVNPGLEDVIVTPGSSEKPHKSDLTTLRSPRTESVTATDRSTLKSTVHSQEENQKTTASNAATGRSDGLTTVTLVGIIVGALLATDFTGGIVFVVVRKMSGRYSI
ncbi:podoplanin [Tamandua tetradactyla]|uniref:podoplanin n=1 Tax=Tamandua tetradactyla TaxID=48850 RepID=UPI0040549749